MVLPATESQSRPPPIPSSPPVLLFDIDLRDLPVPTFSESEDEEMTPSASSASRNVEKVEGRAEDGEDKDGSEQDAEGDDDDTIPSVVANRTRQKTKPASIPEGSKGAGSSNGDSAAKGERGAESKKRKGPVDYEDEDGEPVGPKKRTKATPKPAAKPAPKKGPKGKAAAKNNT